MSARPRPALDPDETLELSIDVELDDLEADEIVLTDDDLAPVEQAPAAAARELSTRIEAALAAERPTPVVSSVPAPPPTTPAREVTTGRRLAPHLSLSEEASVADECLASLALEASLALASDPLAFGALEAAAGQGPALGAPSAPAASRLPPLTLPPRSAPTAESGPELWESAETLPRPMTAPPHPSREGREPLSGAASSLAPLALSGAEPAPTRSAPPSAALPTSEPTVILLRDRGRPAWMLASAAFGALLTIAAIRVVPSVHGPARAAAAPPAPAAEAAAPAAPTEAAAERVVAATAPASAEAAAPAAGEAAAPGAPSSGAPPPTEPAPAAGATHVVEFAEADAIAVDAPPPAAASASASAPAPKPAAARAPARPPRAAPAPARAPAPKRAPALPRLPDGSFALTGD